jgi:hypothetical protein
MPRIDIAATLNQVTYPDDVWRWIDLLGDIIGGTQAEGLRHESFIADNDYKKLTVRWINRDLSTYTAIYVLLRAELIHQAAAHVRLACEALITLSYIAQAPEKRVPLFLGYSRIESYELVESMLTHERQLARASHVARAERMLKALAADYELAKPTYTFRDRNGKSRPFRNWCNVTLDEQARACGGELPRIYKVVYSQLSAYVHGSAWSLRRQYGYSRAHYAPQVVLTDIATVVTATALVWLEWARFCQEQLGWEFNDFRQIVARRVEILDVITFTEATEEGDAL